MQRSSNSDYAKTQLMAIILGYIGAIIISIIDYRFFIKHWIFSSVIGLSLLLSVFIFGMQVDGTDDSRSSAARRHTYDYNSPAG